MGDRGFKKQRDLKLHYQKYHPVSKVPKLAFDIPSSTPDILSRALEGLTIEYNPDVERSFSVELLHQFKAESVCSAVAIGPNERYFAVGRNNVIHVCSLGSGEGVMRFEMGAPETFWEIDYVRDVCFTPDSNFLIAAFESGRIGVCC